MLRFLLANCSDWCNDCYKILLQSHFFLQPCTDVSNTWVRLQPTFSQPAVLLNLTAQPPLSKMFILIWTEPQHLAPAILDSNSRAVACYFESQIQRKIKGNPCNSRLPPSPINQLIAKTVWRKWRNPTARQTLYQVPGCKAKEWQMFALTISLITISHIMGIVYVFRSWFQVLFSIYQSVLSKSGFSLRLVN